MRDSAGCNRVCIASKSSAPSRAITISPSSADPGGSSSPNGRSSGKYRSSGRSLRDHNASSPPAFSSTPRKPSHFGSYCQRSASGNSRTSSASIGGNGIFLCRKAGSVVLGMSAILSVNDVSMTERLPRRPPGKQVVGLSDLLAVSTVRALVGEDLPSSRHERDLPRAHPLPKSRLEWIRVLRLAPRFGPKVLRVARCAAELERNQVILFVRGW